MSGISVPLQQDCIQEITSEEVKAAIFSMNSNSSACPDDFNAHFYKQGWDIVKHELTAVVKSFFRNNYMPRGINSTKLALIPKV